MCFFKNLTTFSSPTALFASIKNNGNFAIAAKSLHSIAKNFNLREIDNTPCDYFVICSGNSNTQVSAIVGSVQKNVSKLLKEKPFHTEGSDVAEWVLIDYVNVVVHVFQKQIREYYNIEELWGDAKTTQITSNY